MEFNFFYIILPFLIVPNVGILRQRKRIAAGTMPAAILEAASSY
jgi:hypothetical protein